MVANVINEMAERIEKQLADQRALLATVSHEIRTPLSRMRLLIEFAREKAEANLARLAELRGGVDADGASRAAHDVPLPPLRRVQRAARRRRGSRLLLSDRRRR